MKLLSPIYVKKFQFLYIFLTICNYTTLAQQERTLSQEIYTIGNFQLSFTVPTQILSTHTLTNKISWVSEQNNCSLIVTSVTNPGHILFSHSAKTCDGWFSIASGTLKVQQSGGVFEFTPSVKDVCNDIQNISIKCMHNTNNTTRMESDKNYFDQQQCQQVIMQGWMCHRSTPITVAFFLANLNKNDVENDSLGKEHFNSFNTEYRSSNVLIEPQLEFHVSIPTNLKTVVPSSDTSYQLPFQGIRMEFDSANDEHVLGLGFQYTYLDMKGRTVPLFAQEQGVGRGKQPVTFLFDLLGNGGGGTWWTSYGRVPHFMTSSLRSLYLTPETSALSIVDFACQDENSTDAFTETLIRAFDTNTSNIDCNFTNVPHTKDKLGSQFRNNDELNVYSAFSGSRTIPPTCNHGAIQVLQPAVSGRILNGNSPADIIKSYTEFSGRQYELPEWFAAGGILGLQGGTQVVRDMVDKMTIYIQKHFPRVQVSDILSGLWMQDWTGQRNFSGNGQLPRVGLWWNWEVDATSYPDWPELVDELHSKNIRVTTYINPLLHNVSERGTPYTRNFFQEGLASGYFVHVPCDFRNTLHSIPGVGIYVSNAENMIATCVWFGYGSSAMVDFTNPAAKKWYLEIIHDNMLSYNGKNAAAIDGWMADFGESIPLNAILYDTNIPITQYHNQYPLWWQSVNAEAIQQVNRTGSVVFFSRSQSMQSPSVTPLFWLGDQLVSWDGCDGLQTAIIGMLSSGVSGFALTHSDLGGYTTLDLPPLFDIKRSQELLLRWCEVSAFSSAYRSHLGSQPSSNIQITSNNVTMHQWVRFALVFRAWYPYRAQLMRQANQNGQPIVRAMQIQFPESNQLWNDMEQTKLQYMVGDSLLVAPVTAPGAASVQVWLPAGIQWRHLFRNTTIDGSDSWHTIHAPIGEPAVFFACPQDKPVEKLSSQEGCTDCFPKYATYSMSTLSNTCQVGIQIQRNLQSYGVI